MFPKIGGFPPKSSILIEFSIRNHPFWGTPIFGNIHIASLLHSVQLTATAPEHDARETILTFWVQTYFEGLVLLGSGSVYIILWVVVSNICYFSSLFGEDSQFDYCNICQMGWNHQLVLVNSYRKHSPLVGTSRKCGFNKDISPKCQKQFRFRKSSNLHVQENSNRPLEHTPGTPTYKYERISFIHT